jgi:TolA-binding protein
MKHILMVKLFTTVLKLQQMRKIFVSIIFLGITLSLHAQFNNWSTIQNDKFIQAKNYYQSERISLAFPLFYELQQSIQTADKSSQSIKTQEINYYTNACRLMLNDRTAEKPSIDYIATEQNNARRQMLSFHLAEFYFRNSEFDNALAYYEKTTEANLSNKEIASMQFHAGYIYFTNKNYEQAKPYLDAIRLNEGDPNYYHANYYYGFIALQENRYSDATQCFTIVEKDNYYGQVVPFYLTQIYYLTGQKDKAIKYGEERLKYVQPYYDAEMKQLVGHALFEKKEFARALPYLEQFMSQAEKVRREDVYELSYCYYYQKNYDKAISGFKQLSGKEDSLSQNSMYLLADCYLTTKNMPGARQAFLFCSQNNSNSVQREVSLFNYAKLSYELGYQDAAIYAFRDFINYYPNSKYQPEATDLMVQLLAKTNNYKDALALISKIQNPSAETQKYYARILFGRSQELISDGQLNEADELLSKALVATGNNSIAPLAKFWKGEIALRNKNYDNAIKWTEDYVKVSNTNFYKEANTANAKYNLGQAYLNKEMYTNAYNNLEAMAKPASATATLAEQDAYLRAADCMFMLKSYPKALQRYDAVVNSNMPNADYAYFQKAIIAGITNNNQKIDLLKSFTSKYPGSYLKVESNLEIANAYLAMEKFPDAITYLKIVANDKEAASFEPQALLKLGVAYANTSNRTEALQQFNSLVNKYPNSSEAEEAADYVKELYIEEGNTSGYSDYMRKTGRPISISEEDSLAWRTVLVKYSSANHQDALPALLQYIQRYANGAYILDANYYTGVLYEEGKQMPQAIPYYSYVADKAPNRFAERSFLQLAKYYYFEQKDYMKAKQYFKQLEASATNNESKLEALKGLLRSNYQLQAWSEAVPAAEKLVLEKSATVDDKVLCYMVIGKAAYGSLDYAKANTNFKQVISINKSAFAAEARYYLAEILFKQNKMKESEKAALEVINKSGSYTYWITKAYILLADIYAADKDYFNAKATLESVVANAVDADLKQEASVKLDAVIQAEKNGGKIGK